MMKTFGLALVGVLTLVRVARADDDPGMAVMQIMLKSPSISSDGKHVAMYSIDKSTEKDTNTSLIVFSATGKEEKRVGVAPPNTDAKRTMTAVTAINKILDAGGYKRMARVESISEKGDKTTYTTDLKSEDVNVTVSFAKGNVEVTGTRGDAKLAPVKRALPKVHGKCAAPDSYNVVNTISGYDATKKLFAFALQASQGDSVCAEYDFVVTLK